MTDNKLKYYTGHSLCPRHLLFFAAMLFLSPKVAAQDWKSLPFPLADQVTGISFLSEDSGYVVTSGGQCVKTNDGGKTWTILPVNPNISLEDVSFVTTSIGLTCGRSGSIYRTNNAGATWENVSVEDSICWLTGLVMVDESEGIVVGISRSKINSIIGLGYRTEDSGKTWLPLPPMGLAYGEPFFAPGKAVSFLSWGQINTTRDRGRSWSKLKTLEGKPGRAISFHGLTGLMVGNDAMVAYSANSGRSWTFARTDVETHFTSVVLVTDSVGYIGGLGNVLLRTFDAGRSWDIERLPKEFDVFDLELIGEKLYAVGSKGTVMVKNIASDRGGKKTE